MGTEEHQSIGAGVGAVAVDHLSGLSPQVVTQPAINGDGAVGEIAVGDVLNGTVSIHRSPDIALHLPREVEDHDGQGVVHPEQTQEHVVPCRHLAGAATAGAVARETEAYVHGTGTMGICSWYRYQEHMTPKQGPEAASGPWIWILTKQIQES